MASGISKASLQEKRCIDFFEERVVAFIWAEHCKNLADLERRIPFCSLELERSSSASRDAGGSAMESVMLQARLAYLRLGKALQNQSSLGFKIKNVTTDLGFRQQKVVRPTHHALTRASFPKIIRRSVVSKFNVPLFLNV